MTSNRRARHSHENGNPVLSRILDSRLRGNDGIGHDFAVTLLVEGFTQRYNLTKLVYYEACDEIGTAIVREKQLKAGSRAKKLQLINGMNPTWGDLSEGL